jgi:hypothetical protein
VVNWLAKREIWVMGVIFGYLALVAAYQVWRAL